MGIRLNIASRPFHKLLTIYKHEIIYSYMWFILKILYMWKFLCPSKRYSYAVLVQEIKAKMLCPGNSRRNPAGNPLALGRVHSTARKT